MLLRAVTANGTGAAVAQMNHPLGIATGTDAFLANSTAPCLRPSRRRQRFPSLAGVSRE